jgi:hypothetical protein
MDRMSCGTADDQYHSMHHCYLLVRAKLFAHTLTLSPEWKEEEGWMTMEHEKIIRPNKKEEGVKKSNFGF